MMFDNIPLIKAADHRRVISDLTRADEEACIRALYRVGRLSVENERIVANKARHWLELLRAKLDHTDPIERLLAHMRLTDKEGLALMALAEALPRVPDDVTADALIADKLSQGNWRDYLKDYPDLMSKLAWLGLSLGKEMSGGGMSSWIGKLSSASLREAVKLAMKKLGTHFVLGATIEQALSRSLKHKGPLERYSFDMLGEAARSQEDADRYFQAYKQAIIAIGASPGVSNAVHGPAISVKLSALHPRYIWAQHERVMKELTPRLLELIDTAASQQVGLTIDAEEADRLELSLDLIEKVLVHPTLKTYHGFGCAVQAYQKRAPAVLDWLNAACRTHDVRMTVRLVKGAYWDAEVKRAQSAGLSNYPVYTRKEATDIAFLACARKLLDARGYIYPQFGTHNLRTALSVIAHAGETRDYEFQRLHGMGTSLHAKLMEEGFASCVYAPVGPHKELLSYLIRRLMENSANSSFVNQLHNPAVKAEAMLSDPFAAWESAANKMHPAIPLPKNIYGGERENSQGLDLEAADVTEHLENRLKAASEKRFAAFPLIAGKKITDAPAKHLVNPANHVHATGHVHEAMPANAAAAMQDLNVFFPTWSGTAIADRCLPFEKLANKMEQEREVLMALLCFEAGKTMKDALNEVREAVDYCRYYSQHARRLFGSGQRLTSISGERNELFYEGRGVFVCISPWNFPLAIFLGQVTAALLAGNTVAAKPAEQTPLIATKVIEMLLECGLPPRAIALLPGDGAVGAGLVSHAATAGVVFTGSNATARSIQRSLATGNGPIVPFIAETGGINALITDSSALPEQIIDDVMESAFYSAGQRCSAARLLCVQASIADETLDMLKGAIAELNVGDPALLATDVGPVIDAPALEKLVAHERRLKGEAKLIGRARANDAQANGNFMLPQAWEIPSVDWLKEEVFGPILHVVRYKNDGLNELIAQINALGFGLTGGIHSRINPHIELVKKQLRVGNLYINRSIVGAVVGAQPFGGDRLSGTGPKAGGPNYLLRFAAERAISDNLTALGGNPELLKL